MVARVILRAAHAAVKDLLLSLIADVRLLY
jgi:hypothetical protein